MTPKQLQAFVAVAQTLSFARAGERVHLSQPALSLSIRHLEEELGGALFSRTTRQVRLTPEGAALLPQALQLLADWENVRERLKQRFSLRSGHVTLAAMPSFAGSILPAALLQFRQRFPGIGVSVHDVVNEQVAEMVLSGRVELGVGFEPEGEPALNFEPLFTDRFIAIVPPDAGIGPGQAITWARLLTHDFIALQRPSSMRRLLEESLAAHGLNLKVAAESHQLATVIRWVAAGLGVSAVPAMLRQQALDSGARVLSLARPAVSKAVGLITRRAPALSAPAEAARQVLQQHSRSS